MREGTAKTMDLQDALRLCAHFGISPWWLAGMPEPQPSTATPPAIASETVSPDTAKEIRTLKRGLATALKTAREALALAQGLQAERSPRRTPKGGA